VTADIQVGVTVPILGVVDMILKIGKLCISGQGRGNSSPKVIMVEQELRVPRIIQTDVPYEFPRPYSPEYRIRLKCPEFNVKRIEASVGQSTVCGRGEGCAGEGGHKPVVEEKETLSTVQKLRFEDKEVVVPNYKIVRKDQKGVEIGNLEVMEITCTCGNKYMSNHTKCEKCGQGDV